MSSEHSPVFGAIEAGGTKFVLAIGRGYDAISAQIQIPTTDPAETLQRAIHWFQQHGAVDSLGIASFGPVDLDIASKTWGYITETTKPDWSHRSVAKLLGDALCCPAAIDTDVNGAALGEYLYGAAQECDVAVYVTVGTGVGGGAIINGQTIKGMRHPEMGHVMLRRHPDDLDFSGVCSFHGDCLEGLASGPAIKARWGASLSALAPDHPSHDIIADYLAQFCQNLIALYSPQRIILGGGVMQTNGLLEKIRLRASELTGSYFGNNAVSIICGPGLGIHSGIAGAFELARRAWNVRS